MAKDLELVQLIQAGDQEALLALYDRYSRLVYAVALRVLKNPAAAEDVTQELFIKLWTHPDQIRMPSETLHGWMVTASRNRAIDSLRRKLPEQIGDLVLTCPSDLGKQIEHKVMCQRALASLETDHRVLIQMAFFQDMTYAEIAIATGYPLGTIKSRIRRALTLLRGALLVQFPATL